MAFGEGKKPGGGDRKYTKEELEALLKEMIESENLSPEEQERLFDAIRNTTKDNPPGSGNRSGGV